MVDVPAELWRSRTDLARDAPSWCGPTAVHFRGYDTQAQREMVGTSAIADVLDEWSLRAEGGPVVDFGWTMASLAPVLYERLRDRARVLVIHRHPVEAAASCAVRGHYTINKSPAWAITPMHQRARYWQFSDRWAGMTPFEKGLYRWLEVTAYGLELKTVYPGLAHMVVPSDAVFNPGGALRQIADFCGFVVRGNIRRASDRNAAQAHHVEQMPIKSEWEAYARHPEVVELGESLGYDMSKRHVAEVVHKYQLPGGIGPWIRHRTGFWPLRFAIGRLLRALRIRSDS